MTVQAVFFDMGGTIETFGYTRELRLAATPVLQQRLLEAGIDLQFSNEQLYEVITSGLDRYKRWSISHMVELPPQQVWSEYVFCGPEFEDVGHCVSTIAEDLMMLVETRYYQRAMRPEMPAVLQAIRKMGLKIGLISNINSLGMAPANLAAYGIIDYFDPIVLSSQYGRRKPDPSIFHYAARLANVPTSACVYVGDRVRRDIDGARRAGFGLAVQIKHDFRHGENDDGAAPDALIEEMTELIPILCSAQAYKPEPPGRIRAFIFDAGDILYYRTKRGKHFAAFLKELGIELNLALQHERKAIEHQAYRGQISHDAYREAVVRLYGISQAELVERGKQALIDDDANVHFFDGVKETLLALKEKGYLLAIVTDTANSISTKLNWFEQGGFGHVWDSIISSVDLRTRKPDPIIYQAALKQLGTTADQAVFVGHRTYELAGARAVGMRTIAFNYDKDAAADFYVEKFSDLLQVPVVG